jgi:lipopolysaccharide biosynthesis glycosyltransferase
MEFYRPLWIGGFLFLAVFLFQRILLRQANIMRFLSHKTQLPSVFFYMITIDDNRIFLAFTAIFHMLTHMSTGGYNCSLTLFFYNEPIPTTYGADLRFLRSIQPNFPIVLQNISLSQLIHTGISYPWEQPVVPGQFFQRNLAITRLFLPWVIDTDWYLYLDTDVIFRRGEFFPEVMRYTSNSSKVLFAVADAAWRSRKHREGVWRYNPALTNYFGSGFLLLRNGPILRRELQNTIGYFANHMELRLVDQDALNFAFNWQHIELLSLKFCACTGDHRHVWDWAYGFHFAGIDKMKDRFLRSIVRGYLALRDDWGAKH